MSESHRVEHRQRKEAKRKDKDEKGSIQIGQEVNCKYARIPTAESRPY